MLEQTQWLALLSCLVWGINSPAKVPPSIEQSASEPVKYMGRRQTDPRFFDGALPHAVGAHHYQAFRANREHPSDPGEVGWTYNHQPYLCYWNGRFYLQYLSNVLDEHNPPGRTLLMTSNDGRTWSNPIVLFPIYSLPEIVIRGQIYIAAGTPAVMHQRMGFYVAPNGRLLTLAFYGYSPSTRYSPNTGNGLGRVVREIHKDGTFGPIYFIRYNRHAGFSRTNTTFPFYKTSGDEGFVAACEAIMADKLMSFQWWEEDRGKDGFYPLDPSDVKGAFNFTVNMVTSMGPGKALCYYFRPDGVAVALWKNRYSALSPDRGLTWTPIAETPSILEVGAKTWGQRTQDGRYALVYNHNPNRGRYPMTIMTGDDGREFDDLLCLQGEVPPRRYEGSAKSPGSQYIRGILPGNGDPPGDYLWNVYSMNKEDIWCTRTRLPISGTVTDCVSEDFETAETEADLEFWNLYMPKWAAISVGPWPRDGKRCLVLRDKDPYDYALAERVFPESKQASIEFTLLPEQARHGRIEIDVTGISGARPVQLSLLENGQIQSASGERTADLMTYKADEWLSFKIDLDCVAGKQTLAVNGRELLKNAPAAERADVVQRIVFRTGQYRRAVPEKEPKGNDLPDAGEAAEMASFYLDHLSVAPK